jgi:hypothetical protein
MELDIHDLRRLASALTLRVDQLAERARAGRFEAERNQAECRETARLLSRVTEALYALENDGASLYGEGE